MAKRLKEMMVLAKQAFGGGGGDEIRLPYKSLRERLPDSPVPTCSSKTVNTDNFTLLFSKLLKL